MGGREGQRIPTHVQHHLSCKLCPTSQFIMLLFRYRLTHNVDLSGTSFLFRHSVIVLVDLTVEDGVR